MRVTFFRVAERKSPKKGRPCCLRPLRCAAGQPGVLGHGVHRRTRCAPAALRSDNCGESDHEARALRRACHPAPCAPQAHTEGTPGSGHPRGPLLRSAALGPVSRAQAPRTGDTGPSAAMARMDVGCLDVRLSHPCWLRLRRGGCGVSMGVGAPMLRALTRRSCPNEAAKQRSEFCGAPRNRPAAGLPRSEAQGSQTGGRLFFAYFLLAKQKKVSRLPGRQPGSHPQPKHAFQTSTPWLRSAQLQTVGGNSITIKTIAASA